MGWSVVKILKIDNWVKPLGKFLLLSEMIKFVLLGTKNNYNITNIFLGLITSLFEFCWSRRLCVRHSRWHLQCLAGHCYYQLSVSLSFLAQAALHVPPDVAFAMRSWPLLLPSFSLSLFFSFYVLLLTNFGEIPEAIFGRFFFFLRQAFGQGRQGHP